MQSHVKPTKLENHERIRRADRNQAAARTPLWRFISPEKGYEPSYLPVSNVSPPQTIKQRAYDRSARYVNTKTTIAKPELLDTAPLKT